MSEQTILLIEDEAQIRRLVRTAMEEEGYRVRESGTLKEGLAQLHADAVQLLILDLGLPDGDGIAFLRDLRTQFSLPVLVLSARSAEGEKIRALDAGADDYLTKPYYTGELLARVRAQLRRAPQESATAETHVHFGDIEVNLAQRSVTRKGLAVRLTPIEFRLLCAMLVEPGKVLTYRHLLSAVWGKAFVESNHYLRIYVSHLRQKLEEDPAQPRFFVTETGVGYRLDI
ncbi:response regulator [Gallionella capsiferriformans]|jgi:two-component system KDP operon response regulator KdpE|uniref:Two component transcriptional regulator, winged helix family n=1 Tax=Gallionella capsiferriformans (strain ES-2) TaxID=395494 RepID=D9SK27_GALCS|nr:response regulator [Gallionella capsiferriformans]ADL56439.1 two component transcriptional regulator, winged helix family [Gallionella capsiferriformans ES-2]